VHANRSHVAAVRAKLLVTCRWIFRFHCARSCEGGLNSISPVVSVLRFSTGKTWFG